MCKGGRKIVATKGMVLHRHDKEMTQKGNTCEKGMPKEWTMRTKKKCQVNIRREKTDEGATPSGKETHRIKETSPRA